MTSKQQQAVDLSRELEPLKCAYTAALEQFYKLAGDTPVSVRFEALRELHKRATDYFNGFERQLAQHALLEADLTPEAYTYNAETALNLLETVCKHFGMMRAAALGLNQPADLFRPSETAYSGMQKLVAGKFPEQVESLRSKCREAELSTAGFDRELFRKVPPWERVYAIASGTVFLLVVLLVALFLRDPSPFQALVFRVVLGLSAGIFASFLLGFFNISGQLHRLRIQASGGFAVFVLVYLLNPPALLTGS